MGVTSTSKQVHLERIDCDGTLQVTLALSASPDIVSNPTDIVLTLDRSDSLGGAPDAIGSGSRIGIVSFNQAATADTQLITSVAARKDAADALDASGSTNHAAAFSAAMQLFDPQSANAKVIVLFTDGKTTAGPPPRARCRGGARRGDHPLLHRPDRLRRHRRQRAQRLGHRSGRFTCGSYAR